MKKRSFELLKNKREKQLKNIWKPLKKLRDIKLKKA